MYELLYRSSQRPWAPQPEKLVAVPDKGNSRPLILHMQEKRFRLKVWKAIVLCAALRLADTALGFGFIEPTHSLAAQEIPAGSVAQECNP